MNFPLNSKPFLIDSPTYQSLLLVGIFLLSFFFYLSFLLQKLNPSFFKKFDLGWLLMAEPSPEIETLDEDEPSPTAPVRSLSLSSPIRQIQNPDESPPSSDDECIDSQILRITSPGYSFYGDLYNNRTPRRYMRWNLDYSSDDDDLTKPIDIFRWSSSLPKINKPTGVGAGLSNSGNTCFIASVLQCLTHTVPLLDALRTYKYHNPCNCGNENFCVLQTLRNHTEHALRSSGYDIKIDRFRDNLNYFSSDFQIDHQEDAHEFLQSFLDKLEKCCLDPGSRDNSASASVSSQDVNIVHNIFGGRLVSKLRCCNCNSVSETFETSPGWSLEIEDVEDLSSALESFTCVEKLEDQFTCDDCKEKVSKEKQLKFDKLPLVAAFHLKRFKNNGVYMQKIFKDVKFPLELDLLSYMSSNENPQDSTKYHLYAMVEHLGNGIHFGHYSAYVRSAPETWHRFDDAKVWRISEECVLSKDAYMLFYAREGTPCFASAFEELKTLFEATPMNLSPKSVLETTTTTCSEECVSDLSYQTVSDSNHARNGSVGVVSIPGGNYSDYHCDEAQDEMFHSAESNSDDEYFAFESPKADDSEKPFAETFHQEEHHLYPDGNRVSTNEASVPVLEIQEQVSSPKHAERAMIGEETYLTKRKMQKQNPFSKGQGPFQIRREHLQNKKREESCRPNVADPKEKKHAVSYLMSRPHSSRSRMIAAAMGVKVKRKKVCNIRRSHLHRNFSERQSK
ncbi:ubiquitin carboxyl-terminal hydrolase 21-like isoform X2 [Raphanus sativus]|uniref:Ubiquitin carboxyl-terminal hydrolase n=1 Tax=Raphanus sativus TaxID=3726 RepID=A0A9W3DGK5_RAPSA|nr:ubiquitin carboxyl-terminal hydrolase 21-like isoform X2 [Raphanus sativus]